MGTQASIIGTLESAGFSYTDEAEIRRREKAVGSAEVQQAARWLLAQQPTTVVLYPKALSEKQE